MTVVCNTSPIVALARAGYLDMLRAVHGEIIIPDAVFNEITVAGAGEPGALEVNTAAWIRRRAALDARLVTALGLELDAGEAEAIALAIECNADLILLDERAGRHAAQRMGLTVTGTLGVLIAAKDRSHLTSLRPVLDALRTEAGFWISDALYVEVLSAAGEQVPDQA